MFLLALLACSAEDKPADDGAAPDGTDDTAADDTATDDTGPDDTGPDDTGPDGEAAWTPLTFYVSGEFGYDPAADAIVSWTFMAVTEEPHLRFHFFDAGGWACVASVYFPTSGEGAPALEAWTFRDTIEVEDIGLEATMHHTGFSATPERVDTECPALDPAVWGADSVADLLLAHDWGVGFGPVRADKAYDASDILWGGSIYSEVLDSGTPPVEAMGYASAAELDEAHAVRVDIDLRPILYTFDEVDTPVLPRGVYYVDGATWFDAELLAL